MSKKDANWIANENHKGIAKYRADAIQMRKEQNRMLRKSRAMSGDPLAALYADLAASYGRMAQESDSIADQLEANPSLIVLN